MKNKQFIKYFRKKGYNDQEIMDLLDNVDLDLLSEPMQEVWIVPSCLILVNEERLQKEIKPVAIYEEKHKRTKVWNVEGYEITQIKVLLPSLLPDGC